MRRSDGSIAAVATTGGVAVALDALMRERGGTWIAHGAGNADAEMVDANDRVTVPPDAPCYTLRRIWLSADEEKRYYGGFANEGLWPLWHIVHVRPLFRSEDWEAYQPCQRTLRRGGRVGADHTRDPGVHPGLSPRARGGRAAARSSRRRTALFWHIPWPHPDRLRICPWRREILRGLLANDLLAFQLERDRRNFLLGVREELDADVEEGAVTLDRPPARRVIAAPIGVDFDRIQAVAADPPSTATSPACSASSGSTTRKSSQSASASIGSTTPRAFPSGSTLSTRCSRCARSCGASWRSCRSACRRGPRSTATRRSRRASTSASPRSTRGTDGRSRRADPLPQVGAQASPARRPLPARRLLHRQLAARRDEPRGQGVRRGARGPRRRAGAERDDRRGAGADGRADHQPL